MYILVKKLGDDATVIATCRKPEPLRKLLKKDARRIIREYYFNVDEDDDTGAQLRDETLASIDAITTQNHWDDGDEEYLLSYDIVKAPELKVPSKTYVTKYAFGSEVNHKLEDAESGEEFDAILEEYGDTDMLVVRRFNTQAEKDAYTLGLCDNYGNEAFCNINREYPAFAKRLK